MTRAEKDFIHTNIHLPWAVQQLCIAEDPDSSFHSISELHFHSINEVLKFGDIPFYTAFNDDLAYAFLPLTSPLIFSDLNQLLIQESGYYIAAITLPGINIARMGNLQPDIFLHASTSVFRNMVCNIETYISFQQKPEFSQSMLDNILDEMKEKPFQELSHLKQIQLRHLSTRLTENDKTNL